MTLFKEWRDLIENQTEATFKNFWEEYSGAETRIYSSILDNPEEVVSGTLGELAENMKPALLYSWASLMESTPACVRNWTLKTLTSHHR